MLITYVRLETTSSHSNLDIISIKSNRFKNSKNHNLNTFNIKGKYLVRMLGESLCIQYTRYLILVQEISSFFSICGLR